ncbi:unnamed protein product [Rotaria socialis]|uniref:F-box domain-containing protein n=1 Tax=Rotaria socialis TaxID=392032 RepID=A0A820IA52_9BILA|nr:unnamed protein product [Rotaria socialis]CAF4305767.1 unnamed protein product [Rotaria socialis]
MNTLNNNDFNILDLPDEILLAILNKLNTTDVFHSLVDVNQQFDRLTLDYLHVRNIDMTDTMTINSLYDQTSSIDTKILSKICEKVLPRIHHQVYKLTIEQYSMQHIILAANYPQLYSLSLTNFQEEILYQSLTDDLILRDLLTKQITHLNIDIKKPTQHCSITVSKSFELILCLCKKLIVLNFCDMFPTRTYETPMFYLLSTTHMSSTLIKLKINVASLVDCLCLLDGRLEFLSTLIINIGQIFDPILDIGSRKKLPKLKYLSLTAPSFTCCYDTQIVPLLCRMINLEELKLYLSVARFDSTYVDGIQLYDQFLICMTHLKKFTFCINTEVFNDKVRVEFPSNEDIQRSFIGRGYQQVTSYVRTNLMKTEGYCFLYSVPYDFEDFVQLNNSYQGGKFQAVRQLTMHDKIPFEHKLFKLISEDFPFLRFLYLSNRHPQQDKQHSSTLITFPYLTSLYLQYAHVDYVELFLLKNNAHLPRLLNLRIEYESLTTITNNFTNNVTYFNFDRLRSLDVCQAFVRPENFHQYFPLL